MSRNLFLDAVARTVCTGLVLQEDPVVSIIGLVLTYLNLLLLQLSGSLGWQAIMPGGEGLPDTVRPRLEQKCPIQRGGDQYLGAGSGRAGRGRRWQGQ